MIDSKFARNYRDTCISILREESNVESNNLLILLYHGVSRTRRDTILNYNGKHLFVDEFADQIRTIKANCNVLSVDELTHLKLNRDQCPENTVVITFDDGYKNNFSVAAPILSDFQLPATFYVCPGMIDTDLEFWTDKIAKCIDNSKEEFVSLNCKGEDLQFPLGNLEEKIAAIEKIKTTCKSITVADKNDVIGQLENLNWSTSLANVDEEYLNITWEEVKELDADPLFTIGGHSLYHDILSLQSAESMIMDITICQQLLKYQLVHDVEHFSYPEGGTNHYNAEVVNQLKKQGVVCSPSGICGLNSSDTNLFHLKRVMVGLYGLELPRLWDCK